MAQTTNKKVPFPAATDPAAVATDLGAIATWIENNGTGWVSSVASSTPSNPYEGLLWYRTDTKMMMMYTNSTWYPVPFAPSFSAYNNTGITTAASNSGTIGNIVPMNTKKYPTATPVSPLIGFQTSGPLAGGVYILQPGIYRVSGHISINNGGTAGMVVYAVGWLNDSSNTNGTVPFVYGNRVSTSIDQNQGSNFSSIVEIGGSSVVGIGIRTNQASGTYSNIINSNGILDNGIDINFVSSL